MNSVFARTALSSLIKILNDKEILEGARMKDARLFAIAVEQHLLGLIEERSELIGKLYPLGPDEKI